jgi:Zn finger protein HypA/HybF involved in hydrogenase expression
VVLDLDLVESILKCYECQKTSSYEEVQIVNRGGKKFWVCPHCHFETPIVEKKAQHAKRVKKT